MDSVWSFCRDCAAEVPAANLGFPAVAAALQWTFCRVSAEDSSAACWGSLWSSWSHGGLCCLGSCEPNFFQRWHFASFKEALPHTVPCLLECWCRGIWHTFPSMVSTDRRRNCGWHVILLSLHNWKVIYPLRLGFWKHKHTQNICKKKPSKRCFQMIIICGICSLYVDGDFLKMVRVHMAVHWSPQPPSPPPPPHP